MMHSYEKEAERDINEVLKQIQVQIYLVEKILNENLELTKEKQSHALYLLHTGEEVTEQICKMIVGGKHENYSQVYSTASKFINEAERFLTENNNYEQN